MGAEVSLDRATLGVPASITIESIEQLASPGLLASLQFYQGLEIKAGGWNLSPPEKSPGAIKVCLFQIRRVAQVNGPRQLVDPLIRAAREQ